MTKAEETIDTLSAQTLEILDIIRKKGPLTISDIRRISGMRPSTLNRAMLPLKTTGLINISGAGISTGGRKPSVYKADRDSYHLLGIDISRTYTRVSVTALDLEIMGTRSFPMDGSCSPAMTVKNIISAFNDITCETGIKKGSLVCAGLAVVGPLDEGKENMLSPGNFASPDWTGTIPIKKMLEDALGIKFIMENGASAAVAAEYFYGSGRGYESIAYFNCGIGIRNAAIISGTLVKGKHISEDAFGHMIVDVDGDHCTCGHFGCVESYSSVLRITGRFLSELKKGRSSTIKKSYEDITFTDICSAAAAGDPLSNEIISGSAVMFGTGLANYISLIGPSLIILSGPLISRSESFYSIVCDTALKKVYMKQNSSVSFMRQGRFGEGAMSVGAAALAYEKRFFGNIHHPFLPFPEQG